MKPELFDELVQDLTIERTMGMSMCVHAQIPLVVTIQAGSYRRGLYRGRLELSDTGTMQWITLENTFADSKFLPHDDATDRTFDTIDLSDDQSAQLMDLFGCQSDFPPEVSWQLYCLHMSTDITQWTRVFHHVLMFPKFAHVPLDDITEALRLVYLNLLHRFASGHVNRMTPGTLWNMIRDHLHLD